MADIGDNSRINNAAADELRSIVERVERMHEERRTIDDDVKDIYGEARGRGYDVKAIKRVIAARRKDRNERIEEDSIFETYMLALGEDVYPQGETACLREKAKPMRKSQQIRSRTSSARLFRKQAQFRRMKRSWLSVVVKPLQRMRKNTRLNRMRRRMQVLRW